MSNEAPEVGAPAAALVADLRRRGVLLWVEGERLRLNAPKGVLTSELRTRLGALKTEILALLRPPEEAPPLKRAARSDRREAPMSFTQERLWFTHQLEPDSPAYNIPMALEVDGDLDRAVLAASLRALVGRHEILRTTSRRRGDQRLQRVADPPSADLPVVDLGGLGRGAAEPEARRLIRAEADRPFDLDRGPLLRSLLVERPAAAPILLLNAHHFVADGWSLQILWSELRALYGALAAGAPSPLPELPIQFADFARWQRRWLRGATLEHMLRFWRQQLGPSPPVLELPTDRPRPALSSRGAELTARLPPALCERFRALAEGAGTTPFIASLAAFQVLLGRLAGQRDVVVGTAISQRGRPELEGLIGPLSNNLVLRLDLAPAGADGRGPSFRELLARARERVHQALAHQDLPFEKLVADLQPDRALHRTPLFQVMFMFHQPSVAAPDARRGPRFRPLPIASRGAKFDLTLAIFGHRDGWSLSLEYSTELYDATTARRLLGAYRQLLDRVVRDPDRGIDDLELTGRAEHQQLVVEWNDSGRPLPAATPTLDRWFAAQAARTPDAVAVVAAPSGALGHDEAWLTYGELARRSGRLARHLRRLGVGAETTVGIAIERSPEMVIALLAVLEAGGAYVPLDASHPRERLRAIAADAALSLILADRGALPAVTGLAATTLAVDGPELAAESPAEAAAGDAAESPDRLAYILFTSGSTGRPKGVMVAHRELLGYLHWAVEAYALEDGWGAPVLSPLSFDLTVTSLWAPLVTGRRVLLLPAEGTLPALARALEVHRRPSLVKLTPTHLGPLAEQLTAPPDEGWRGSLILGGEALSGESLGFWRAFAPGTTVVNEYGPTETVVGCAVEALAARDVVPGSVAIGRPIANLRIHLFDRRLRPVPIGVPGELHIAGAGVTRGYLRRPGLTAETFIPDPFAAVPGARMYQSGDLARHRSDGTLEFLGRRDHQVKIRGFRVELGEIEAVLLQHSAVRQAVVTARGEASDPGGTRLVAYVVPADGADALDALTVPSQPQSSSTERRPRSSEGEGLREASPVPTASVEHRAQMHRPVRVRGAARDALLRDHLRRRLPDHMVPAAFVFLDALPVLASGKVDRRALPAPELDRAAGELVPPRGAVEERLAALWGEILGVPAVSRDDNFFDLGGHSLLVTQVASRIQDAFGVELSERDLFQAPTLAELEDALLRRRIERLDDGAAADVLLLLAEMTLGPSPASGAGARDELAARGAALAPEERVLLHELLGRRTAGSFVVPPIGPRTAAGPPPLSFPQERLWLLHRLDPSSVADNIPGAVRLVGPLDLAALRRSLAAIVERHHVLRTTIEVRDGEPVQRIEEPAPDPATPRSAAFLPRIDLDRLPEPAREAELRRLMTAVGSTRFDLARGPLLRLALTRLDDGVHALLLVFHHIVSDAWSLGIFVRELTVCYRRHAGAAGEGADPLPELPIQYADYAAWQRQQLTAEALAAELDYWRRELGADQTVLELPADRPRSTAGGARGGTLVQRLDAGLWDRLEKLARDHDATRFMVLLAAFQTVLGRWAGQDRVRVGSPVANRRRPEVEPLIGCFINTLVFGADLSPSGDSTFGELLARVRETTLGAYSHQNLPFAQLVEAIQPERDLGHTPLFQVMLVLQNQPRAALDLPGIELQPLRLETGATAFDLVLGVMESAGELVLHADYRADLFDRSTVGRLLGHFRNLLSAVAERPATRLTEAPLSGAAERHQLLAEWNDAASDFGRARRAELTLHDLFAETAARFPERVALVLGDHRLTYRELDRRADRLGGELAAHGVAPDVRVAIAMERSVELIVAILAVLKAGGAYLPLDPGGPAERLAWVLADAGAAALVTRRREAEGLGDLPLPVLAVDPAGRLDAPADAPTPAAAPRAAAGSDHLAYVIYTSGSTGRPKGVMVPHRGVVNTLLWRLEAFSLGAGDAVLQNIAFTFDPSLWQIFGALLSGARLVLVPPGGEQDYPRLVRRIVEERITITDLAPSMLEVFLEQQNVADCRSLRLLFAGGEALPPAARDRFLATLDADLRNIYGPTEASIDAACWRTAADAGAPGPVPIGRPVANKRLLVLGPDLVARPLGAPGELVIGGEGLARGYVGRPARTAESFLPDPWARRPGGRLYRTGDLVAWRADGTLCFLGRRDRQVKVRGFRIELGEVEAALGRHPGVREAAAVARAGETGDRRLLGYFVAGGETAVDARTLRDHLRRQLPAYMVPSVLTPVDELPRTASGKVDYPALPEPAEPAVAERPPHLAPQSEIERTVAGIWRQVLGLERLGVDDNFFDLGGHSLLLIRIHGRLEEVLDRQIPVVHLFNYPTVRALAHHLDPAAAEGEKEEDRSVARGRGRAAERLASSAGGGETEPIAILAMTGRFPDAGSVEELWQNLCAGVEGISFFDDQELARSGVPAATLADPEYVKAGGVVAGAELFDAGFFDFSPREAEATDPQQRLFLEACWQALEEAGYAPGSASGAVGVYAGVSTSTYLLRNLLANPAFLASANLDQLALGSDKDFLATRVSYKLDLTGPSLTVQTACSTSLVAVHLAVQALHSRQCDLALAGGCSITVPQALGYRYREGGVNSPDGHCRAFDAAARGTVGGNGLGVVVLKPLGRALADGDPIRAVIRGTAINNDGAFKVGYTAPSVDGQAEVIATALAVAGVEPSEIGYVEAHGTGTALGDPIEIAALSKAFGRGGGEKSSAVGSLKSNIGHLDAAAGVAGLIKAALAVERGQIPPSLHFREPNPEIDFDRGPFYVNAALSPWPGTRRAGVSSFGIGGTNAHAVIEEPPAREPSGASRRWQLVQLSARSEAALEAATDRLARHLEQAPETSLPDLAFTLMRGRRDFEHRRVAVCRDAGDAREVLAGRDPRRLLALEAPPADRPVAFLFPGQGAQYAGMARGVYEAEPIFRRTVDRAAEILEPHLGLDLRSLLFPPPERLDEAHRRLAETALTQPALFAVEAALTRLLAAWGVRPAACLGHSIGEYVAAWLAGVLSFDHALALVAARGRLMQGLPAGAMLSVPLAAEELAERLGPTLALAAVNSPGRSVISGPGDEVAAFARALDGEGIASRRLHTSHAFHSPMMDPILDDFAAEVAKVELRPPETPYLSNLTGRWITAGEATDPGYWVRHLRHTVRFADGVAALLAEPGMILLEVGPGRSLGTLARRAIAGTGASARVLQSLPHPQAREDDEALLLTALGRLWLAGVTIDPAGFWGEERRRRIALPTYPFERRRYWVEGDPESATSWRPRPAAGAQGPGDWTYAPTWSESLLPAPEPRPAEVGWLVFLDSCGLGEELAGRLAEGGQRVVTVAAGEAFAAHGEGFTLRPGRREDYPRLVRALTDRALPSRIVHLWAVSETAGGPALEGLDLALERGFYSLLYLAQALAAAVPAPGDGPGLELTVVTNGLHEIGGEEDLDPRKATLLGPVKAIPLEIPGIRCRSVDVVLAAGGRRQRLLDQLAAELAAPPEDPVVAWRGGRRFLRTFNPVPAADPGAGRLRRDGVVLITGGLGGIGLELARGIAETVPARLVLVGRGGLPPRRAWDSEADPELRRRIDKVRHLETLGAEVLVLAADVSDREQMGRALAEVRRRWGAVHGVVHAAGVAGSGPIATMDPGEAAAVLAPKVHGTLVLDSLLAAEELDFFLLCSSLASLLGGVGQADYAAANAFLDAFAGSRREGSVQAVNWDAWSEVGMAARSAAGRGGDASGLRSSEGVEVFRRVLAGRLSQTIVSRHDFPALVEQMARRADPRAAAETPAPTHQRPEITTPWIAPRNETEERLAGILQEVLGIDRVGIDDDFTELGGDSLLAIQIIARVRESFGVELKLRVLFEAPSVAQLAVEVLAARSREAEPDLLDSLLQDLNGLSEEEVEALLAGDRLEEGA